MNKKLRRVWRYQKGNQNPYIEEEQTTSWPRKKYKRTNNDLQNTHTTKDRVTLTPLKQLINLTRRQRIDSHNVIIFYIITVDDLCPFVVCQTSNFLYDVPVNYAIYEG